MGLFKRVDTAVATVHTWVWVVTLVPTGITWILAAIERLPASRIMLIVTAVLASTTIAAYYGILIFRLLKENSKRQLEQAELRAEQTRIETQLKDYEDAGHKEIDTVTAAAIWANTIEDANLNRHLKFRIIKAAIRKREIKNTRQVGGGAGPNIHTRIPMNELRAYFVKSGVIKD